MSFHCPKCDGKTFVIDTRAELRKRRCSGCKMVFLTEETEVDGQVPYKPGKHGGWRAGAGLREASRKDKK